jgi:hypothetical protein
MAVTVTVMMTVTTTMTILMTMPTVMPVPSRWLAVAVQSLRARAVSIAVVVTSPASTTVV